jgi:hypothetical protein
MAALRVFNLGVRFLLELASLAAFGYWGATLRTTGALRASLAIAIPLAVALLWGLFISPKARYSTGRPGQVGLGLLVFLVAALAAAFAGVAVISSALLYLLPQ